MNELSQSTPTNGLTGPTVVGPHPFARFEMAISFDVDETIVAVHGEVDLLTAPTLQSAVDSLLERGAAHIVLDLAELTFMDASGLRVIAHISARLATLNRVLAVRSAPAMTRLILEITRLDELVRLEATDGVAVNRELIKQSSRSIRARGPKDETIEAALRRLTELVGATVDGADGVSITLERGGRLSTVAASNDTVMRMDDHQYETGEGPCLSAAGEGLSFTIESLAGETRWPAFVPRALEEGIASILSTPLMAAERPLGALNIYSNTERAFGPHQHELAALFAAQASGILADAGADAPDKEMDKRISDALIARQTIARAQGVLMEREHISADQAAASIHQSARTTKIPVARHAKVIVDSTSEISDT
jgi:anti-anti-sigma factor